LSDNAAVIERFYTAFAARDGEAMAACYHPEVRFSDPVFPNLVGDEAGDMWRMLTEQGKDLEIEFSEVKAEGDAGSAHWDARYTFSATGRKVLNRIDARFVFKDGLIVEHDDRFDLWKWTRMALGPTGLLLGWSPIVQTKVRGQAAKALARYRKGRAAS
jgi:ketosteroid isomerase-like protein